MNPGYQVVLPSCYVADNQPTTFEFAAPWRGRLLHGWLGNALETAPGEKLGWTAALSTAADPDDRLRWLIWLEAMAPDGDIMLDLTNGIPYVAGTPASPQRRLYLHVFPTDGVPLDLQARLMFEGVG